MAQQQQTELTETLQDRIETLVDKGEYAQELAEEVEKIQQQRERASSKNDAFRELATKVRNTREQHHQLQTWAKYATRMNVGISRNGIHDRQSQVEGDTQSLQERTWDDFENVSEIRDTITIFEDHREAFRDLTTTVREAVQNEVDDELESVDRVQTLLQIPDISDEEAEQTCRNYQYHLKKLADGKPEDDVSPDKWESYHSDFEALDIDLGDDLTDDAKEVIWLLLEDETVTLAEIDEAVLDDLKSFKQFSERLSIQFTTQP